MVISKVVSKKKGYAQKNLKCEDSIRKFFDIKNV